MRASVTLGQSYWDGGSSYVVTPDFMHFSAFFDLTIQKSEVGISTIASFRRVSPGRGRRVLCYFLTQWHVDRWVVWTLDKPSVYICNAQFLFYLHSGTL